MNYLIIFILCLFASLFSNLLSKFIFSYFKFKEMKKAISPLDDIFSGLSDFLGDLNEKK